MFYKKTTSVFWNLDNEEHFPRSVCCLLLISCTISQVKEFCEPYDDIWYVTFVLIVEARQWFFLLSHCKSFLSTNNFQTSVAPQLSSFSAVTPWYFSSFSSFLFSPCYSTVILCFNWNCFLVFKAYSIHTPTYTFMALLNDIILKFFRFSFSLFERI